MKIDSCLNPSGPTDFATNGREEQTVDSTRDLNYARRVERVSHRVQIRAPSTDDSVLTYLRESTLVPRFVESDAALLRTVYVLVPVRHRRVPIHPTVAGANG